MIGVPRTMMLCQSFRVKTKRGWFEYFLHATSSSGSIIEAFFFPTKFLSVVVQMILNLSVGMIVIIFVNGNLYHKFVIHLCIYLSAVLRIIFDPPL
jgi:hypothetical protein